MAEQQDAAKLLEELKAAIKRNDLRTAQSALSRAKVCLGKMPTLPPLFRQSPTAQQDLTLAREILEHAVLLCIQCQDEEAFKRNYTQLRSYYTDARQLIPLSSNEQLVIGLHLLYLLVRQEYAEFHSELELLPSEVLDSDYIKLVKQLEQWLMEGAYNKVLDARSSVPEQSYAYFMDKLLSTCRRSIAECSERAYDSLSTHEAKRLLLLKTDKELESFADESGWEVSNGKVTFGPRGNDDAGGVPALDVIKNTLFYAREMERIV